MAFMEALSTGLALAQPIANYFEGQANRNAAAHAQRMNSAHEKQMAESGIRMRVNDATLAGIHPLAALGASVASPTSGPNVVGGGSEGGDLARSLGDMGQNISRSVAATRTADERALMDLQLANARADLDGKVIENQLKTSQLQNMKGVGPAFPSPMDKQMIPGQGNSIPGYKVVPSEATASALGQPGRQAGAINSLQCLLC